MAPHIASWDDLAFVHEKYDKQAGKFQDMALSFFDSDDNAYFGRLNQPKKDTTLEQVQAALLPIPDSDLFPEWEINATYLTEAPDSTTPDMYIKRPMIELHDVFQENNVLHLIPASLSDEAQTMEMLEKHPHPNIVRYHGCRIRRGRITGLVLERHPTVLSSVLEAKEETTLPVPEKRAFMDALHSSIQHLHALGWAHNDVHPDNILVSDSGQPVLIDFGSAKPIGEALGTSRGTQEWIDGEIKDYDTSEVEHDVSALDKISK